MNKSAIKYYMPQDLEDRNQISEMLDSWLLCRKEQLPAPPVSLEKLMQLAGEFIADHSLSEDLAAFIIVSISNFIWQPWLQGIPYNKRLLLLPDCLASSENCKGHNDQFGLICHKCGNCDIETIERHAKGLGYLVLIAEGSPVVAELIKTGQIQGIVGVSCFEALDKVFEHVNNAAVPAVAVPLLVDGCKDTEVETERLIETISTPYDNSYHISDHNEIKDTVNSWFTIDYFSHLFNKLDISCADQTSKVSIDWIIRDGKRHRPFMTAAVYDSLCSSNISDFPESVINSAIAIELFHKASLVHDDIEDNDNQRYGQPTVNNEYGDAFAINVGDFLIGTGYRIVAELDVKPEIKNQLLIEISKAHQQLSSGQGAELAINLQDIKLDDLFAIYRDKTSPAFRAALLSGAILAGADNSILEMMYALSDVLGIAYQIKDDLEDTYCDDNEVSILHAVASDNDKVSIAKAELLLSEYRDKARDVISDCPIPKLKFLLTRMITKITE